MFVRKSSLGFHIIYQAAHGLLAGEIVHQLQLKYRPNPWLATLVAIIEHDDHQLDFDEKNYLFDLGMPMDFTEDEMSTNKTLIRAKRVMDHAKSKSLWTALLVSYHLEFLYNPLKEDSKKAKNFLENQENFRHETISHFRISKSYAESVYELLRFCDRCSLILCKEEIPDAGRKIEINTSIENKTYFLHQKEDGNLTVEPWCFQKDEFKVSTEQTFIGYAKFKNQKEFQKVLEDSPRGEITWKFQKI